MMDEGDSQPPAATNKNRNRIGKASMRSTALILGLVLEFGLLFWFFIYPSVSGTVGQPHAVLVLVLVMAILWFLAVVFVVALPLISVVCYALAGVVALGGFLLLGKLGGWVLLSLALVVLSLLAWRERHDSGR